MHSLSNFLQAFSRLAKKNEGTEIRMNEPLVLLVGADEPAHGRLAELLRLRGYAARFARSSAEAAAALDETGFALTLVDANLPGTVGTESLEPINAHRHAAGPIIVFSHNDPPHPTLEPLSLSADHIIRGALTPDTLQDAIRHLQSSPPHPARASDSPALSLERETALWRSARMQEVWRVIKQAANVDVTVLISGETGTGKDLVARAIHHLSSRRRAPYVAVNCAALPKDLLESELFGHERGAFTGAHQLKIGKFESANRGTILLDEVAELHAQLQAKLLHVLQDGTFSRVGGKSAMKADVRVLAATNRDLALAVSAERFRDDLYYRLNVIHIVVPPLRERPEEIPLLAAYFVERYSQLYRRESVQLSQEVMERLMRHRYPGNVRELENIIKRLIVLGSVHATGQPSPSPRNGARRPDTSVDPGQPAAVFLKDVVRKAAQRAEREEILKMLERTRWNRSKAAKFLHISYRSLLYKMKDAGLDRTPPTAGLSV
jgi:two-component system response regulator AtoC